MLLKQLKEYLVSHRKATLSQIARDFSEDPGNVEYMLRHWINKGKVVKKSTNCSLSCKGCLIIEQEYHWQD